MVRNDGGKGSLDGLPIIRRDSIVRQIRPLYGGKNQCAHRTSAEQEIIVVDLYLFIDFELAIFYYVYVSTLCFRIHV